MGLFLDKIVPLLKENGINCVEAQGLGEVLMKLLEENLPTDVIIENWDPLDSDDPEELRKMMEQRGVKEWGVNTSSEYEGLPADLISATKAGWLSLIHALGEADKDWAKYLFHFLDIVAGLVEGATPNRRNKPPKEFSEAVLQLFVRHVPFAGLATEFVLTNHTVMSAIKAEAAVAGSKVRLVVISSWKLLLKIVFEQVQVEELDAEFCELIRASRFLPANTEDECINIPCCYFLVHDCNGWPIEVRSSMWSQCKEDQCFHITFNHCFLTLSICHFMLNIFTSSS